MEDDTFNKLESFKRPYIYNTSSTQRGFIYNLKEYKSLFYIGIYDWWLSLSKQDFICLINFYRWLKMIYCS